MRALLCTNHLAMWSGSELVILDLAEALRARRWKVRVVTNAVSMALAQAFRASNIGLDTHPQRCRAFDFDLVWVQHHMGPLLDFTFDEASGPATRFVFAHLSSYTDLEQPGFIVESLLADLIVCNSVETRSVVVDADIRDRPCHLFQNPAPSSFQIRRFEPSHSRPRRIVSISNHLPDEMDDALTILSATHGIEVLKIGQRGNTYERVTPERIMGFDVVVTIGKSVQYAMAAGIPVYCYDRFGGPGYLNPRASQLAEQHNFSGRCTPVKRGAHDLVMDLLNGYERGRAHASQPLPARFCLEHELDLVLSHPVRSNREKFASLREHAHRVRREALMAGLVRRYYRSTPTKWLRIA